MRDNPLTEQEYNSIPAMLELYPSYEEYLKSTLIEV